MCLPKDGGRGQLKTLECLKGINPDTSVTHKHWQQESVRKTEQPSSNVNASARGMAWVATIMANNGKDPDGKTIVSQETCQKMHEEPKEALDLVMGRCRTRAHKQILMLHIKF